MDGTMLGAGGDRRSRKWGAGRRGGMADREGGISQSVITYSPKVREERSLVSAMAWDIVRPQLILTTIEPQSKFIASMRPREGVNVRHPAAAQAQPIPIPPIG
jgi:hypothetical protein